MDGIDGPMEAGSGPRIKAQALNKIIRVLRNFSGVFAKAEGVVSEQSQRESLKLMTEFEKPWQWDEKDVKGVLVFLTWFRNSVYSLRLETNRKNKIQWLKKPRITCLKTT